MTTERHDLIDPSRIDYSLVRRRLARMTKAGLVESGVDNFERVVDLLNNNDQLRRERNEEALARHQTDVELARTREVTGNWRDTAAYYQSLLAIQIESTALQVENAFRRGRLSAFSDMTEARYSRMVQFQPGILTFAQMSASFVGRVLDRLSNIEHVVIGRISLGGEGVLPHEVQEKNIDPNFR